jgi:hypothetical protein
MQQISFRDKSLDYNGSRYFADNAQLCALAAYGEKAGGLLGVGKLEPKDRMPAKALAGKVRSAGPVTLNGAATSKAEFTESVSGNIQAVGFSGTAQAIYDALVASKLKFVQLYVDENDMRKVVNAHPKVRDEIHGYGADGRIVHTVFIAMLARTAEAFSKGASVLLEVDALGILSASVGGASGSAQATTVSLSPGTCIAYGLLKLEWSSRDGEFDSSHVDEPGLK